MLNTSVCTPGLCEPPLVGSFLEALSPKDGKYCRFVFAGTRGKICNSIITKINPNLVSVCQQQTANEANKNPDVCSRLLVRVSVAFRMLIAKYTDKLVK